jgi:hypothetical protein
MALYEMRTYTLYVGKMAEAQKLYTELGFPALKKGGHDKNLVGYFVADTGMINQLVHIWKFKDDGDRRAHWAGRVREQGFRRGVCFEVPTAGDEPGGEADDRGAVGAASVRGRYQAPGPRSQIDGGDDLRSSYPLKPASEMHLRRQQNSQMLALSGRHLRNVNPRPALFHRLLLLL